MIKQKILTKMVHVFVTSIPLYPIINNSFSYANCNLVYLDIRVFYIEAQGREGAVLADKT